MKMSGAVGRVWEPLRGVVTVLFLAGCSGSPEAIETPAGPARSLDPPGLETLQKAWTLVSLQEPGAETVDVPVGPFAADFGVDGDLYIEADCNVCSAAYRAGDDGSLEVVGPFPCTLAYCPTAPLDTRFLMVLEGARKWSIDEGTLRLSSPDGGTLLLQSRP